MKEGATCIGKSIDKQSKLGKQSLSDHQPEQGSQLQNTLL